jgi:phage shock protein C
MFFKVLYLVSCISNLKKMEKKLFRIKNKDSKLGGVALGLSEYFDTDVSLIRALFVILLFVPHFHLGFIYFILWLVLPVKNEYSYASNAPDSTETSNFSNLNFTNMSNHSKQGSMTGGMY